MLVSSAATFSEPCIVGSILVGADDLVSELVRARLGVEPWEKFSTLGVILRGRLVGGVIYHDYRKHDVMMSAAFDDPGWARKGVLRAIFGYPFNDLGVCRVTAVASRKNERSRRLLRGLGFKEEGAMARGFDGKQTAILHGMLRENCKWIDHERPTDRSRAA